MTRPDWTNYLERLWIALAAAMGVVIAARLFFGPFALPGMPVNTPLNPEGIFGLSVVILLVLAKPRNAWLEDQYKLRFAEAAVGIFSVAALWRGLGVYFLSDDFVILRQAKEYTAAHLVPIFTTPGGDGFFRPVGLLSFGAGAAWAGAGPATWHALALVLHTVNAILVVRLARRMRASTLAALFAGALFAVHGGRPEAVTWIAARFDLLAAFFVLAAFLLFERGWFVAAAVCFVLAVWSKESAYVFPALLVPFSIYLKRPLRRSVPFFGLAAALLIHRLLLFGGIGGYVEAGQARVFSLGFATTLKAVFIRLWTGLFFPIDWSVAPSLLLGVLCLAATAATLWIAARTKPAQPLWLLAASILIAILPPLHLLSAGADLAGARLVYLPSIFFCLLLAMALDGVASAKAPLAAAVLLFHAAALQHNLDSWLHASDRVRAACQAAAGYDAVQVTGLPLRIRGAQAFNNGFAECVDLAAGHSVAVRLDDAASPEVPHLRWNPASEALERVAP